MRQTREDRGVTIKVAAEATRMKMQTIQALEADEFARIAAPIYVKGFLKLYGDYLDLDTDALVEAYLKDYAPASRPSLVVEETEQSKRRPPWKAAAAKKTVPREKKPGKGGGPSAAGGKAVRTGLGSRLRARLSGLRLRPEHLQIAMLLAVLVLVVVLVFSVRGCIRRRGADLELKAERHTLSSQGIIREPPAPYLDGDVR